MTQAKLYKHRSTVCKIEKDKHRLKVEQLLKICDALEIEPGQLFMGPNRPSLDAILRDCSNEQVERFVNIVETLRELIPE